MMVCITLIVDRAETTTHWVVALCGVGVLFQVMDTLNYWFQCKLQSKYAAIATAISCTRRLVPPSKVWLLFTGKSVEWFAVSTSIDYLVAAMVLLALYKKQHGPQFSCSLRKAKELLGQQSAFYSGGPDGVDL